MIWRGCLRECGDGEEKGGICGVLLGGLVM